MAVHETGLHARAVATDPGAGIGRSAETAAEAPSAFRPPAPRLLAGALAFGTLGFLLLAADVHFDGGVTRLDLWVGEAVYDATSPAVRAAFRGPVSFFGEDLVVMPLMILAMAWVARLGRWRTALVMGASAGVERLAVWTLKGFFAEARPLAVIAGEDVTGYSHSFPSGHAAVSSVWYGLAIYFLLYATVSEARRDPRPLIAPAVALWVLVAGVGGVARVLGGVHWPSDVLASWALGLAWIAATILVHEAWVRPYEQLAAGRRPTRAGVL